MMKKGEPSLFKGRKHSEETRKRMSEIHKKNGSGKWMKGRKLSSEAIEKRRKSTIGKSKHTIESRRKIGEKHKGPKCIFWKGGITQENSKIRKSFEYKLWREEVFKRDNFTCTWCGLKGGWNVELKRPIKLNADHIKPFAYYPELRLVIDNGRTLCVSCHKRTPTWGINQFTNKVIKKM